MFALCANKSLLKGFKIRKHGNQFHLDMKPFFRNPQFIRRKPKKSKEKHEKYCDSLAISVEIGYNRQVKKSVKSKVRKIKTE